VHRRFGINAESYLAGSIDRHSPTRPAIRQSIVDKGDSPRLVDWAPLTNDALPAEILGGTTFFEEPLDGP
jgi:hypothetical protein